MADKTIGQLVAATNITPTDLFVLEQSGTAKKLTGQILENWLVSYADGHGGIQSIVKTSTSGLVDTYTITLADTTTVTFTVTNGRAITGITTYYAVSSSGSTVPSTWSTTRQSMTATNRYLWSYQHIAFNGGSPSEIDTVKTVIGVWGDKGDQGDAGRGIVSLAQTSRDPGQYTLYTFNMSDGTTETFYSYDGVGISSIEKTSSVGLVDVYTITYTNNTTTDFSVTNAKSITSVELAYTSGLTNVYRINFNDGTNTQFTVTNGSSIDNIDKTSTQGLVDTYTVTLTNGETDTFTVTNAKSISSIVMISGTHAAGTTDVYRITYNDGDTFDFSVYNGQNGTGAVSTVDGIPADGAGNVQLLITGNGAPTTTTAGNLYQRYFDLSSQILYICIGVDTSTSPVTYSWAGTGVSVDSALSTTSQNPVQNAVITAKVGTAALNTTAQNLSGAVNELDADLAALPATVAPLMDGSAAVGTSPKLARQDHVHPHDSLITNRNLLDNWYFVGGGSQLGYGTFPVNQRGQATYNGAVRYADRWRLNHANMAATINANFVSISNNDASLRTTAQIATFDYSIIKGKTLTASILLSDGSFYFGSYLIPTNAPTSNTGYYTFLRNSTLVLELDVIRAKVCDFIVGIPSGATLNVVAVKMELGSTQTLAHQKNGTWVLNEIPNYSDELTKCRRYYRRYVSNNVYDFCLNGCLTTSKTHLLLGLPDGTPMVIRNPRATISGSVIVRGINGYIANPSAESVVIANTGYSDGYGTTVAIQKSTAEAWTDDDINNTPIQVNLPVGTIIEIYAE